MKRIIMFSMKVEVVKRMITMLMRKSKEIIPILKKKGMESALREKRIVSHLIWRSTALKWKLNSLIKMVSLIIEVVVNKCKLLMVEKERSKLQ